MSIYDDLQNVATDLFEEFNQGVVKLVHFMKSDDSSPDEPLNEEKIFDLRSVGLGKNFNFLKESFSTEKTLDITTSVIPDVVPTIDDFLDVDGVRLKILEFKKVPEIGTPCVWKFTVEKGG